MVFVVIAGLYAAVEVVRNLKSEDDRSEDDKSGDNKSGDDKKINWLGILVAFVIGVGSVVYGVYDLPLNNPIPKVRDDKAVYFYPGTDEAQTGVLIQYSLNSDDKSEPKWVDYELGESIEITQSPTKIYYRSKFLWRTTDIESQTAYIDAYNRVYLDLDFVPEVTYKKINAEFNKRSASAGEKGNTYVGYELQKSDFTVIGVVPDGEDEVVKDFAFSPTRLKKGANKIEITYSTRSGQNLSAEVVVSASDPKLLSIEASLLDAYQEGVVLGTSLDTTMFDVTGTYENDTTEAITDFTIDPVDAVEEGNATVTISKGTAKATVTVPWVLHPHTNEDEDNGEMQGANDISPNGSVRGTLGTEEDVDYYRFVLRQKGSVKLVFKHEKEASTDAHWRIELLDGQEEPLLSMESSRANKEQESIKYRLASGTYYVKVSRADYYTDDAYELYVDYIEEDDTYETEDNGEMQQATEIQVNSDLPYTGNLSHDGDLDYYRFSLPQKGKVRVTLTHEKRSDDDIGWYLSVNGDEEDAIVELESTGGEAEASTNAFRAGEGEYYVLVKRGSYNWSTIDYSIAVSFVPEGDDSESEPNNDFDTESVISNGGLITGNIHSRHDIDYYKLDYNGSGNLKLVFKHSRSTVNDSLWRVRLVGTSSNDSIRDKDDDGTVEVCGSDAEKLSFEWVDLSVGTYYVIVESDYGYTDADYGVAVSW